MEAAAAAALEQSAQERSSKALREIWPTIMANGLQPLEELGHGRARSTSFGGKWLCEGLQPHKNVLTRGATGFLSTLGETKCLCSLPAAADKPHMHSLTLTIRQLLQPLNRDDISPHICEENLFGFYFSKIHNSIYLQQQCLHFFFLLAQFLTLFWVPHLVIETNYG